MTKIERPKPVIYACEPPKPKPRLTKKGRFRIVFSFGLERLD